MCHRPHGPPSTTPPGVRGWPPPRPRRPIVPGEYAEVPARTPLAAAEVSSPGRRLSCLRSLASSVTGNPNPGGERMASRGQVIDNPISGERITFRQTAADTDGELLAIDPELLPDGYVAGAPVPPPPGGR